MHPHSIEHHEGIVRGAPGLERNMLRAITGDFAKVDRYTMEILEKVLT